MSRHAGRKRWSIFSIAALVAVVAVVYLVRRDHPTELEATQVIPATTPTIAATAPAVAQTQPTTRFSAAGAKALAEGQVKLKDGELLAGRKILNDALVAGTYDEDQLKTAKELIASANQTIVFSARHFPDDPYGGLITVTPGQTLAKIATQYADTWEFLAQINHLSNPRLMRAGQTLKIIKGPFNVVVTKQTFTMDIWLGPPEQPGSMYITSYRVGLGADDSTPTGTWIVQPSRKLRNPTYFSPRGQGIIAADDPKNPLGKYWIGLEGIKGDAVGKMSYGIHGTNDPSSIGKMSSLGCIHLGDADIAQAFNLLVEGKSTVIIREKS